MTTYNATPSSNLQTMINALLPGDVLILAAGTYNNAAITVGVSGSPTAPITIRGTLTTNYTPDSILRTPNGAAGSQQGWKITGSYLHFECFQIQESPRGLVIEGASHVKARDLYLRLCRLEGVQIKSGAHHIFLWAFNIGSSTPTPGKNFTKAIRVGSPSSEWPNASSPDRTHDVHIFDGQTTWHPGWGVEICEGSHHVLVEDVHVDHSMNTADMPLPGAANGDGNYRSGGDDVHFLRCMSLSPPVNHIKVDRVSIGGVEYGQRNVIKGGGSRPKTDSAYNGGNPAWFPPIRSNSNDLKVIQIVFLLYPDVADEFDDTGGDWAADGWMRPATEYKKLDIGGPAREYTLEPMPHGHHRIWGEHFWRLPGGDTPGQSVYMTNGIEFVVDRPGGYLVGFSWFRHQEKGRPTLFRLYREEPDVFLDPSLENAPPGPDRQKFNSDAEFQAAYNEWLNYYGQWLSEQFEYQNYPAKASIVETTTAIPPAAWAGQRWEFEYLATPYELIPSYHYIAGFMYPPGTAVVGSSGWSLGMLFPDYWGRTYGCNGIGPGHVLAPAGRFTGQITDNDHLAGLDNKPGNITNRRGNSSSRLSVGRTLPGENIAVPESNVFTGGGTAFDVIVSFARQIPETITVLPGQDLQSILDSRIPGDTVILSGVHIGEFVMRESGTASKPIHLKGDGSAALRYRFGSDSSLPALRVTASFIWLEALVFEHGRQGLLIENAARSVRVEGCTARQVGAEGFIVQEDAQDVCFLGCTAHDTGLGKLTGEGFRIGRHAGSWIADSHPDNTRQVLLADCAVYRAYGDGVDVCDGCTEVKVVDCSVDFSQGNAPPATNASGTAGFYSRADRIQFIACTVIDAPGAGFLIFDSTWFPNTSPFGRAQEVKAGSSTGHGDAGVTSQSEGCRVYADFTATTPRIREIEGGWAAAGSNVPVTAWREMGIPSVAQYWAA